MNSKKNNVVYFFLIAHPQIRSMALTIRYEPNYNIVLYRLALIVKE